MNLLLSFGLSRQGYYSKTLMDIRTRVFNMSHEHKNYFPLYNKSDKKNMQHGPYDEYIDLSEYFNAPDWHTAYKSLDKIFKNQLIIDRIILVFSPFNSHLSFGKENTIVNKYLETIKNPRFSYNFNAIKNLLKKVLFYYYLTARLNIPLTQIVIDPWEPDWTKFNKNNFRYMFYESDKLNAKYIPSHEWGIYNSAIKSTYKIFDFVFGMTSIMTGVDLRNQMAGELLNMQKDFIKHGLSFRLYLKDKVRNIDNLALEGKYDDRIAASKYTLMIPSYAVDEFSTGRFLESIDKDCVPLMHESVCFKDGMKKMPNLIKIYEDNGMIIKTNEIISTIERLNYSKIISDIKCTPEIEQIYTDEFYNKFLKEHGENIFLSKKISKSKTNMILNYICNVANSDNVYRSCVIKIFKKVRNKFEDPEFIFDLNENRMNTHNFSTSLMYNPFMFTKKHQYEKRLKLIKIFNHYYNDALKKYESNFLYATGNGCIDDNCIMVLGMAPGFWNNSEADNLSIKFKPSFYFGNTSQILRYGFIDNLQEIYFTNLSKIALSKEKINEIGYEALYNESKECFKKELKEINPRMIVALGKDVIGFLATNEDYFNLKIPIYRLLHPSAMLIKHKNDYKACSKEYSHELKKILQEEAKCQESQEIISWNL